MDQASAVWARHSLIPSHPQPVLGRVLQWQLIYNRGAILGLGSSHPTLITAIGVLITAALIWAILRWPSYRWPLATMTGGGLGNVLSRLMFGRVTDFIRLAWYPGIMDLADVSLRIGTIWLLVALYVREQRPFPRDVKPNS